MGILSRKKTVQFGWCVALLLEIFILSGCGGGGGGEETAPPSTTPAVTTPPAATAPTISAQPQSVTVSDGGTASFTVGASGSTPLSYQWKRNGASIPGATSATYTIASLTMADNVALFSVDVSNSAGFVSSAVATLTVFAAPPQIVTQPQAQTVLSGNTASFTIAASGTPPLTFQWRKNGVIISGATSATFALPSADATDNGALFDCLVSNASGNVASNTVLLTVNVIVTPPTITAQPQGVSVSSGQNASFSISAAGTSPFTFQWFRNDVAIVGANSQTYSVSPATILNNLDSYKVTVANSAGSVTSNSAPLSVASQSIDLIAGTLGGPGRVDGQGAAARFTEPRQMTSDSAGNLYLSDRGAIRKVTPSGVVTTIAGKIGDIGFVNGPSSVARFSSGMSFAIGGSGDLFVLDAGNRVIRRIDSAGIVSTYAGTGSNGAVDGPISTAELNSPGAAVFDSQNNLFFTDVGNCSIRKITPGGVVSTFAGVPGFSGACGYVDGTGSTARFVFPVGIAIDANDNLYIADGGNNAIRKITPSAVVTTFAGGNVGCAFSDGVGTAAQFCSPYAISIDAASNLYVTDYASNKIRKISPSGVVTSLAGTGIIGSGQYADGLGVLAAFSHPTGIVSDAAGNLVVADTENVTLRKVAPNGLVSTWAGAIVHAGYRDGAANTALFNYPNGLCGDPFGNVFVADTANQVIRKISPSGSVSTFAGGVRSRGSFDGVGTSSRFSDPHDIACDANGNVYVSDTSNYTIRKITSSAVVTTVAGSAGQQGSINGTGSAARFGYPVSIDLDATGNLYVADYSNNQVRKITPAGVVTTLAGDGSEGCTDGVGNGANFTFLWGLAVDGSGNVFVTDSHKMIRKITQSGVVSTFAGSCNAFPEIVDGTGANANFVRAENLAIDAANNIYVAESTYPGLGGGVIRKITPTAVVTTLAGIPIDYQLLRGVSLGPLPGSLSAPHGVAVLPSGSGTKLAVTDENSVLSIIAQ